MAHSSAFFSAREPIRYAANSTIAVTAGLMPYSGHQWQMAKRHKDPRQRDEDQQRWQHEQPARDDSTQRAMHQPTNVSGKLLRFGTRQNHAEIQCMPEPPLGNSTPPFHQFLMHDRELASRAAEADETEFEPEPERL